jgi:hypothetical protein
MVRPLMLRHRIRSAEFFQASSPTNRGIVWSKMSPYPLQTRSHLRGRQNDCRCGRQSERERIKHPNRRETRASRLTRMRHRLRDRRPSLFQRPACNQLKRPGLRQGTRRVPQVKLSQTLPVSRSAQKVGSEPSWLATFLAMKTNPASVGSGECSGRDEAPLRTPLSVVDPPTVEPWGSQLR